MHFNRSLVLCGGLFASLIFSSGIGLGQTAEFSAKLSQWFEELPTVGTDSFVVPLVNPDDHGELGEITLEIDFEDRKYLLGEPIPIRCSLINRKNVPLFIFYDDMDHAFRAEVSNAEGDKLDEIAQQVCEGDIAPAKANVVTVQPNHRLVRKLDLLQLVNFTEAGEYQVRAGFETNGKFRERDSNTREFITRHSTPLRRFQELPPLQIIKPTTDADRKSLAQLLKNSLKKKRPSERSVSYSLTYRQGMIESLPSDFKTSYYFPYAAYHDALYGSQTNPRTAMDIVTDVNLSLLNSIPKSDYPQLFLEDVQYMRVLAIACSQNDLVSLSAEIETFISKFPQSDRVPILSRLREDLGPPSSSNENGPAIKGSK